MRRERDGVKAAKHRKGHSELCAWRFGMSAACDCGYDPPKGAARLA